MNFCDMLLFGTLLLVSWILVPWIFLVLDTIHTARPFEKDDMPVACRPFVVSEYLERMEKANLEIIRYKEANRDTEPITLWIGLYGVRVVDGEVVWVDRYTKPQTSSGGKGGSWYPLQDPVQTLMSPIQYPVVYAAQQAVQYCGTMNYIALQSSLMSQCCSVTAEQMSRALQECCCVQDRKGI